MPRPARRASSTGSEESQSQSQSATKQKGKGQKNGTSKVKENREKWVGIFNDEAISSSTEDTQPSVVSLKHPRTGLSSLFVASEDRTQLFQLNCFSEKYRSWFIGNSVHSEGSLYMTTPIDPLFLILPYICHEEKCKRFMTLDQLICDENFPESSVLGTSCDSTQMSLVADSKDIGGGVQVFRYSKEKTLDWLKSKTEAVADVVESQKISVSAQGSHSAIFVRSKNEDVSRESYLEYAHGIVSDHLSLELEEELRIHLGLPDPNTKTPEISENEPPNKKAKLNAGTEPTEDYSAGIDLKKDKSKNQKLTAAQKRLSKVDKTGMKSISSFFSPKS